METVLQWIAQYGYAGIFGLLMFGIVGLPIPDETLMVAVGFLIHEGRLHAVPSFLSAFAGSVFGITLSYVLGRTAGSSLVHRYGRVLHITTERLGRVHRWYESIGEWLLMVGYFIPGVRHFTALVAGIAELRVAPFILFAYVGAAIWVATFLGLGYSVGANWREAMAAVHRYTWVALLVFCGVGASVVLTRRYLRRRCRP